MSHSGGTVVAQRNTGTTDDGSRLAVPIPPVHRFCYDVDWPPHGTLVIKGVEPKGEFSFQVHLAKTLHLACHLDVRASPLGFATREHMAIQ